MDFLPKNKWIALLVFILIIVVSVVLALSTARLTPDTKNVGSYRFKLGGGGAKKTTTP